MNLGRTIGGAPIRELQHFRSMVVAAILMKLVVSLPLMLEPVCLMFDGCSAHLGRVSVRLAACSATIVGALVCRHHVMELTELAGTLISMLACVVFPCACFLKVCWYDASFWKKACVIGILASSVVFAVGGTVVTIAQAQAEEAKKVGGVL